MKAFKQEKFSEETRAMILSKMKEDLDDLPQRKQWIEANKDEASWNMVAQWISELQYYNPYGEIGKYKMEWASLDWKNPEDAFTNLVSQYKGNQVAGKANSDSPLSQSSHFVVSAPKPTTELAQGSMVSLPDGGYNMEFDPAPVYSKQQVFMEGVEGILQMANQGLVKWECKDHELRVHPRGFTIPCAGIYCGRHSKVPKVMVVKKGFKLLAFEFLVNRSKNRAKTKRYQLLKASRKLAVVGGSVESIENTAEQQVLRPPRKVSMEDSLDQAREGLSEFVTKEEQELSRIRLKFPRLFEQFPNPYFILPNKKLELVRNGRVVRSFSHSKGFCRVGDPMPAQPSISLYKEGNNFYLSVLGLEDTLTPSPSQFNPDHTRWKIERASQYVRISQGVVNMGEDLEMKSQLHSCSVPYEEWRSWEPIPRNPIMLAFHSIHHAGLHSLDYLNQSGPPILIIQEHADQLSKQAFFELHKQYGDHSSQLCYLPASSIINSLPNYALVAKEEQKGKDELFVFLRKGNRYYVKDSSPLTLPYQTSLSYLLEGEDRKSVV